MQEVGEQTAPPTLTSSCGERPAAYTDMFSDQICSTDCLKKKVKKMKDIKN